MWTPASKRALFVLACAGALWLGLVPALAAQAPADLTAYDEALKQAVEAHRGQRWQEAHELFARAHALYPNARTLRGLGISAFEAGQHALALRDLEAALVHPERPLPDDLRSSVQALVTHLRGLVGVYVFRLEPEGAALRIDDAEPIISPRGEVLLDPGRHRATVWLDGHVTQTLELDAHGGDRSEMRVALVPTPVLPPVSVARPIVTDPERAPALVPRVDDGRFTWERKSAIAAGSVGLLSYAAGGVLKITSLVRVGDIKQECGRNCTEADLERKRREHDLPRLEHGMTATVVVGSVFVATSAVFWVLDWRARKKGEPAQHSALPLGFTF